MARRPFIIAIVLAGFVTAAAMAQPPMSADAEIEAYRSAIKSAESGTTPRGIEKAFSAIDALRHALMRVRDGQNTVLELLPEAEFVLLERGLPGVLINREEVVFVRPDGGYFVKLATAQGDAADRAFFAAFKATYPDSVWPVYVEQQTDYSGCVRFGSMSLVETYRAWSEFQQKYPNRYVTAARKESEDVLRGLTESTCACGNTESVEQELEQFIRGFPTSSARTKAEQRLQALRARQSNIRTSCISG